MNQVSDGISYGGMFVGGISLSAGQAEFGIPVIVGAYQLSTEIDITATGLTALAYLINGRSDRLNKSLFQLGRTISGYEFGEGIKGLTKSISKFYPVYFPIIF